MGQIKGHTFAEANPLLLMTREGLINPRTVRIFEVKFPFKFLTHSIGDIIVRASLSFN